MKRLHGNNFIIIAERSSASSDKVFRKCLPLSDIEHASFDFIYNRLVERDDLGVQTKFVYIDTPADICL